MIKTDHAGFVKDDTRGQTTAVLNIDNASFSSFKEARTRARSINQVVHEVNTLKSDIHDIKLLLAKLLDGKQ
jgi:hypothetical protein